LIVSSEYLGECRDCDVLSKERDPLKDSYKRRQKLEALWDQILVQELRPCDIAPRPCEAVDESRGNKIIVGATDHDGDGFHLQLKDLCEPRARNEQYVNPETYEISGACAKLIGCFSEPSLDDHVLAIDPAKCLIDSQNGFVETDFDSSCRLGTGPLPRIPTRTNFSDFCASVASGAARRQKARAAASARCMIVIPLSCVGSALRRSSASRRSGAT
jgi:hypothetical protein